MALSPRLPQLDITVIHIANLADSGCAVLKDQANLTGWQADLSVFAFFGDQSGSSSSRANQLAPSAGFELDIMDPCSSRDAAQGQRIAGGNFSLWAGHDCIAYPQSHRGNDISLLTIRVVQQGQTSCPIGVILNTSNYSWDIDLFALKIDHTVLPLMSATTVTNGDPPVSVSATLFL
jgi:hypothetical protein